VRNLGGGGGGGAALAGGETLGGEEGGGYVEGECLDRQSISPFSLETVRVSPGSIVEERRDVYLGPEIESLS